jgi:hypothetical protein
VHYDPQALTNDEIGKGKQPRKKKKNGEGVESEENGRKSKNFLLLNRCRLIIIYVTNADPQTRTGAYPY